MKGTESQEGKNTAFFPQAHSLHEQQGRQQSQTPRFLLCRSSLTWVNTFFWPCLPISFSDQNLPPAWLEGACFLLQITNTCYVTDIRRYWFITVAVCRGQMGLQVFPSATLQFPLHMIYLENCSLLAEYFPEVYSHCMNVLCVCTYVFGCGEKYQHEGNVHCTVNTQPGWIICEEPAVPTGQW